MENDDRQYSYTHSREPSVDRRFRPCPERQVNLDKIYDISDEEDTDDTECSAQSNDTEPVNVYLRLRPTTNDISNLYNINDNTLIVKQLEDKNSSNKDISEKHYTFSKIFDGDVPQWDIYNYSVRDSINDEICATVLTYGTSGSGKTFTLLGRKENPGIVPRAIEQIFSKYSENIHKDPLIKPVKDNLIILTAIQRDTEVQINKQYFNDKKKVLSKYEPIKTIIKNENGFEQDLRECKSVFIWVSLAEIHNENVYDLLTPSYETDKLKREKLTIMNNKGVVFIKNLTSVFVTSAAEAYELLNIGFERISFAPTAINSQSSRSHVIFMIEVIVITPCDNFMWIKYNFCDLAGSERCKKAETKGTRLVEAQRINNSLLVLGRCLDSVYKNQQKKMAGLIPIRDSKLTKLLQKSLLGKEKFTMIVNLQPNNDFFEENMHTLNFASIAKKIVHKKLKILPAKVTRYSLFNAPSSSSPANSSSQQDNELFNENVNLKAENEYLLSVNRELEIDLEQQQKKTTETITSITASHEHIKQLWKEMELKQEKRYEEKINRLKARIEYLEERLEEMEYYDLENKLDENLIKKRKTLD